jgi:crotonobetainyl-CoA:carnitine CoA-transferase CaiB-like acyl-CoA transferase
MASTNASTTRPLPRVIGLAHEIRTVSPVTAESAAAPLAGVLVADFSRVLAGPLASMFLADLGATVIKVERPGVGDDTRHWGPPYVDESEDMSTYFASVNRNKRSVTLDLASDDDLRLAKSLAGRADVLIENFLPGKLAAVGLDSAQLRASHPALIYCSISGYGSGTGAALPGYDFVVQAVGGLMSITGEIAGEPVKVGVALVDVLTGLHATIAILAALRDRDRTGQGQNIEVNLLSSLLSSLVNQGSAYLNGGSVPSRMGNQHPSIAPYETLATGKGQIALAVGNDRQFRALAIELEKPDLADDARFHTNRARVLNRAELIALLEGALATDTAGNWCARLQAVGVPCGQVNDLDGAFRLAESLGLRPVARFDERDGEPAVATLSSPLGLRDGAIEYRRRPPALGADDAAVRRWLRGDGNVSLLDD